MDYDTATRK